MPIWLTALSHYPDSFFTPRKFPSASGSLPAARRLTRSEATATALARRSTSTPARWANLSTAFTENYKKASLFAEAYMGYDSIYPGHEFTFDDFGLAEGVMMSHESIVVPGSGVTEISSVLPGVSQYASQHWPAVTFPCNDGASHRASQGFDWRNQTWLYEWDVAGGFVYT